MRTTQTTSSLLSNNIMPAVLTLTLNNTVELVALKR